MDCLRTFFFCALFACAHAFAHSKNSRWGQKGQGLGKWGSGKARANISSTKPFSAANGSMAHEGAGKTCFDHIDNDGDGLTDCNDPDCTSTMHNMYAKYCQSRFTRKGSGSGSASGKRGFSRGRKGSSSGKGSRKGLSRSKMMGKHRAMFSKQGASLLNSLMGSDDASDDGPAHEGAGKTCFDHKDNDGDGLTDCCDPDCTNIMHNMYARYCHGRCGATGKGSSKGSSSKGSYSKGSYSKGSYKGKGGKATLAPTEHVSGSHEQGKACFDGKDNDGDGVTDCSDPDCTDPDINVYARYCKGKGSKA